MHICKIHQFEYYLYNRPIASYLCCVCMYIILMTLCTNAAEEPLAACEHYTMKSALNIRLLHMTASVTLVRSVRWSSNVSLRWRQCETGGRNASGSKWKPRKWVCGFQLPLPTWTFEPHLTPKADWVKWLQAASVDRTLLILQLPLVKNPMRQVFRPHQKR